MANRQEYESNQNNLLQEQNNLRTRSEDNLYFPDNDEDKNIFDLPYLDIEELLQSSVILEENVHGLNIQKTEPTETGMEIDTEPFTTITKIPTQDVIISNNVTNIKDFEQPTKEEIIPQQNNSILQSDALQIEETLEYTKEDDFLEQIDAKYESLFQSSISENIDYPNIPNITFQFIEEKEQKLYSLSSINNIQTPIYRTNKINSFVIGECVRWLSHPQNNLKNYIDKGKNIKGVHREIISSLVTLLLFLKSVSSMNTRKIVFLHQLKKKVTLCKVAQYKWLKYLSEISSTKSRNLPTQKNENDEIYYTGTKTIFCLFIFCWVRISLIEKNWFEEDFQRSVELVKEKAQSVKSLFSDSSKDSENDFVIKKYFLGSYADISKYFLDSFVFLLWYITTKNFNILGFVDPGSVFPNLSFMKIKHDEITKYTKNFLKTPGWISPENGLKVHVDNWHSIFHMEAILIHTWISKIYLESEEIVKDFETEFFYDATYMHKKFGYYSYIPFNKDVVFDYHKLDNPLFIQNGKATFIQYFREFKKENFNPNSGYNYIRFTETNKNANIENICRMSYDSKNITSNPDKIFFPMDTFDEKSNNFYEFRHTDSGDIPSNDFRLFRLLRGYSNSVVDHKVIDNVDNSFSSIFDISGFVISPYMINQAELHELEKSYKYDFRSNIRSRMQDFPYNLTSDGVSNFFGRNNCEFNYTTGSINIKVNFLDNLKKDIKKFSTKSMWDEFLISKPTSSSIFWVIWVIPNDYRIDPFPTKICDVTNLVKKIFSEPSDDSDANVKIHLEFTKIVNVEISFRDVINGYIYSESVRLNAQTENRTLSLLPKFSPLSYKPSFFSQSTKNHKFDIKSCSKFAIELVGRRAIFFNAIKLLNFPTEKNLYLDKILYYKNKKSGDPEFNHSTLTMGLKSLMVQQRKYFESFHYNISNKHVKNANLFQTNYLNREYVNEVSDITFLDVSIDFDLDKKSKYVEMMKPKPINIKEMEIGGKNVDVMNIDDDDDDDENIGKVGVDKITNVDNSSLFFFNMDEGIFDLFSSDTIELNGPFNKKVKIFYDTNNNELVDVFTKELFNCPDFSAFSSDPMDDIFLLSMYEYVKINGTKFLDGSERVFMIKEIEKYTLSKFQPFFLNNEHDAVFTFFKIACMVNSCAYVSLKNDKDESDILETFIKKLWGSGWNGYDDKFDISGRSFSHLSKFRESDSLIKRICQETLTLSYFVGCVVNGDDESQTFEINRFVEQDTSTHNLVLFENKKNPEPMEYFLGTPFQTTSDILDESDLLSNKQDFFPETLMSKITENTQNFISGISGGYNFDRLVDTGKFFDIKLFIPTCIFKIFEFEDDLDKNMQEDRRITNIINQNKHYMLKKNQKIQTKCHEIYKFHFKMIIKLGNILKKSKRLLFENFASYSDTEDTFYSAPYVKVPKERGFFNFRKSDNADKENVKKDEYFETDTKNTILTLVDSLFSIYSGENIFYGTNFGSALSDKFDDISKFILDVQNFRWSKEDKNVKEMIHTINKEKKDRNILQPKKNRVIDTDTKFQQRFFSLKRENPRSFADGLIQYRFQDIVRKSISQFQKSKIMKRGIDIDSDDENEHNNKLWKFAEHVNNTSRPTSTFDDRKAEVMNIVLRMFKFLHENDEDISTENFMVWPQRISRIVVGKDELDKGSWNRLNVNLPNDISPNSGSRYISDEIINSFNTILNRVFPGINDDVIYVDSLQVVTFINRLSKLKPGEKILSHRVVKSFNELKNKNKRIVSIVNIGGYHWIFVLFYLDQESGDVKCIISDSLPPRRNGQIIRLKNNSVDTSSDVQEFKQVYSSYKIIFDMLLEFNEITKDKFKGADEKETNNNMFRYFSSITEFYWGTKQSDLYNCGIISMMRLLRFYVSTNIGYIDMFYSKQKYVIEKYIDKPMKNVFDLMDMRKIRYLIQRFFVYSVDSLYDIYNESRLKIGYKPTNKMDDKDSDEDEDEDEDIITTKKDKSSIDVTRLSSSSTTTTTTTTTKITNKRGEAPTDTSNLTNDNDLNVIKEQKKMCRKAHLLFLRLFSNTEDVHLNIKKILMQHVISSLPLNFTDINKTRDYEDSQFEISLCYLHNRRFFPISMFTPSSNVQTNKQFFYQGIENWLDHQSVIISNWITEMENSLDHLFEYVSTTTVSECVSSSHIKHMMAISKQISPIDKDIEIIQSRNRDEPIERGQYFPLFVRSKFSDTFSVIEDEDIYSEDFFKRVTDKHIFGSSELLRRYHGVRLKEAVSSSLWILPYGGVYPNNISYTGKSFANQFILNSSKLIILNIMDMVENNEFNSSICQAIHDVVFSKFGTGREKKTSGGFDPNNITFTNSVISLLKTKNISNVSKYGLSQKFSVQFYILISIMFKYIQLIYGKKSMTLSSSSKELDDNLQKQHLLLSINYVWIIYKKSCENNSVHGVSFLPSKFNVSQIKTFRIFLSSILRTLSRYLLNIFDKKNIQDEYKDIDKNTLLLINAMVIGFSCLIHRSPYDIYGLELEMPVHNKGTFENETTKKYETANLSNLEKYRQRDINMSIRHVIPKINDKTFLDSIHLKFLVDIPKFYVSSGDKNLENVKIYGKNVALGEVFVPLFVFSHLNQCGVTILANFMSHRKSQWLYETLNYNDMDNVKIDQYSQICGIEHNYLESYSNFIFRMQIETLKPSYLDTMKHTKIEKSKNKSMKGKLSSDLMIFHNYLSESQYASKRLDNDFFTIMSDWWKIWPSFCVEEFQVKEYYKSNFAKSENIGGVYKTTKRTGKCFKEELRLSYFFKYVFGDLSALSFTEEEERKSKDAEIKSKTSVISKLFNMKLSDRSFLFLGPHECKQFKDGIVRTNPHKFTGELEGLMNTYNINDVDIKNFDPYINNSEFVKMVVDVCKKIDLFDTSNVGPDQNSSYLKLVEKIFQSGFCPTSDVDLIRYQWNGYRHLLAQGLGVLKNRLSFIPVPDKSYADYYGVGCNSISDQWTVRHNAYTNYTIQSLNCLPTMSKLSFATPWISSLELIERFQLAVEESNNNSDLPSRSEYKRVIDYAKRPIRKADDPLNRDFEKSFGSKLINYFSGGTKQKGISFDCAFFGSKYLWNYLGGIGINDLQNTEFVKNAHLDEMDTFKSVDSLANIWPKFYSLPTQIAIKKPKELSGKKSKYKENVDSGFFDEDQRPLAMMKGRMMESRRKSRTKKSKSSGHKKNDELLEDEDEGEKEMEEEEEEEETKKKTTKKKNVNKKSNPLEIFEPHPNSHGEDGFGNRPQIAFMRYISSVQSPMYSLGKKLYASQVVTIPETFGDFVSQSLDSMFYRFQDDSKSGTYTELSHYISSIESSATSDLFTLDNFTDEKQKSMNTITISKCLDLFDSKPWMSKGPLQIFSSNLDNYVERSNYSTMLIEDDSDILAEEEKMVKIAKINTKKEMVPAEFRFKPTEYKPAPPKNYQKKYFVYIDDDQVLRRHPWLFYPKSTSYYSTKTVNVNLSVEDDRKLDHEGMLSNMSWINFILGGYDRCINVQETNIGDGFGYSGEFHPHYETVIKMESPSTVHSSGRSSIKKKVLDISQKRETGVLRKTTKVIDDKSSSSSSSENKKKKKTDPLDEYGSPEYEVNRVRFLKAGTIDRQKMIKSKDIKLEFGCLLNELNNRIKYSGYNTYKTNFLQSRLTPIVTKQLLTTDSTQNINIDDENVAQKVDHRFSEDLSRFFIHGVFSPINFLDNLKFELEFYHGLFADGLVSKISRKVSKPVLNEKYITNLISGNITISESFKKLLLFAKKYGNFWTQNALSNDLLTDTLQFLTSFSVNFSSEFLYKLVAPHLFGLNNECDIFDSNVSKSVMDHLYKLRKGILMDISEDVLKSIKLPTQISILDSMTGNIVEENDLKNLMITAIQKNGNLDYMESLRNFVQNIEQTFETHVVKEKKQKFISNLYSEAIFAMFYKNTMFGSLSRSSSITNRKIIRDKSIERYDQMLQSIVMKKNVNLLTKIDLASSLSLDKDFIEVMNLKKFISECLDGLKNPKNNLIKCLRKVEHSFYGLSNKLSSCSRRSEIQTEFRILLDVFYSQRQMFTGELDVTEQNIIKCSFLDNWASPYPIGSKLSERNPFTKRKDKNKMINLIPTTINFIDLLSSTNLFVDICSERSKMCQPTEEKGPKNAHVYDLMDLFDSSKKMFNTKRDFITLSKIRVMCREVLSELVSDKKTNFRFMSEFDQIYYYMANSEIEKFATGEFNRNFILMKKVKPIETEYQNIKRIKKLNEWMNDNCKDGEIDVLGKEIQENLVEEEGMDVDTEENVKQDYMDVDEDIPLTKKKVGEKKSDTPKILNLIDENMMEKEESEEESTEIVRKSRSRAAKKGKKNYVDYGYMSDIIYTDNDLKQKFTKIYKITQPNSYNYGTKSKTRRFDSPVMYFSPKLRESNPKKDQERIIAINSQVYVKESPGKGYGLFAAKDFKADPSGNHPIATYDGEVVSLEKYLKQSNRQYGLGIAFDESTQPKKPRYVVDAQNKKRLNGSLGAYANDLNYGKKVRNENANNAVFHVIGSWQTMSFYIYLSATKNIAKDSEIYADYQWDSNDEPTKNT